MSCFNSVPGLWNKKQTMPRKSHLRGQSRGEPMESQNPAASISWSCSAKPRKNTRGWGGKHAVNVTSDLCYHTSMITWCITIVFDRIWALICGNFDNKNKVVWISIQVITVVNDLGLFQVWSCQFKIERTVQYNLMFLCLCNNCSLKQVKQMCPLNRQQKQLPALQIPTSHRSLKRYNTHTKQWFEFQFSFTVSLNV